MTRATRSVSPSAGSFRAAKTRATAEDTILADLDDLAIRSEGLPQRDVRRRVRVCRQRLPGSWRRHRLLLEGSGLGLRRLREHGWIGDRAGLKLRIVPITADAPLSADRPHRPQSSRMSAVAWASSTGATRRWAISSTSATTASTRTAPTRSSPTARHSVPWCSAGAIPDWRCADDGRRAAVAMGDGEHRRPRQRVPRQQDRSRRRRRRISRFTSASDPSLRSSCGRPSPGWSGATPDTGSNGLPVQNTGREPFEHSSDRQSLTHPRILPSSRGCPAGRTLVALHR